MAKKREIKLSRVERAVAKRWHGGRGSMLHAVASAGVLRLGRVTSGMTVADRWLDLSHRLRGEARRAAVEAQDRGRREDAESLWSIERKAARELPPCIVQMGTLCAGHARGIMADEPCDTREHVEATKPKVQIEREIREALEEDDDDSLDEHVGHRGMCGLAACTAAHERDQARARAL